MPLTLPVSYKKNLIRETPVLKLISPDKKYHIQTILKDVPLLYETLLLYPQNILENTFLLARQHLLTDTHLLLLALEKLGLKREHIAIMGKCYSTSSEVVQEMRKNNFDVFVPKVEFDSHTSFDEQHSHDIKVFVANQVKKHDFASFRRLIILDDGGDLVIEAFHQLKGIKNIISIEQTTNGYNKIQASNIEFTAINVARCKSKLKIEAPLIANVILAQIRHYLCLKKIIVKNALIIGNGAIGKAIFQQLSDKIKVHCYDLINSQASVKFIDYLNSVGLIIGCTGVTSVPKEYHHCLKKEIVLASASSSDREFDAVYLRRSGEKTDYSHTNLFVKGIHLLNNGFPINFYGEAQSMPLSASQLTISLLLAGICQASRMSNINLGFVNLCTDGENFILKKFKEISTFGNLYLND